jgi:UDP-glucose 4-epimerase
VNNEHIYIKDITDFEFVTQLIQKEQFDFVIHLAAMVSVVEGLYVRIASNILTVASILIRLDNSGFSIVSTTLTIAYPIYLNP